MPASRSSAISRRSSAAWMPRTWQRASRQNSGLLAAAQLEYFSDRVHNRVRFVELNILGAVLRENLFGIRRQLEQTRLCESRFVLIPEVLEAGWGRRSHRPHAVIPGRDHADGPRAQ